MIWSFSWLSLELSGILYSLDNSDLSISFFICYGTTLLRSTSACLPEATRPFLTMKFWPSAADYSLVSTNLSGVGLLEPSYLGNLLPEKTNYFICLVEFYCESKLGSWLLSVSNCIQAGYGDWSCLSVLCMFILNFYYVAAGDCFWLKPA